MTKAKAQKSPRTIAEIQEQHKKDIAHLQELHRQDNEALSKRNEDLEHMVDHNYQEFNKLDHEYAGYRKGVFDVLKMVHPSPSIRSDIKTIQS